MSSSISGNAKVQLPITKAVGSQHQTQGVGAVAPPAVAVPPPSALLINGVTVIIDVRTMSGSDVVTLLNKVPGISAAIAGDGRLTISGITSFDGNSDLRVILGI